MLQELTRQPINQTQSGSPQAQLIQTHQSKQATLNLAQSKAFQPQMPNLPLIDISEDVEWIGQIQSSLKAYRFHIVSILQRAFRAIKYAQSQQSEIRILSKCIFAFKQMRLQRRLRQSLHVAMIRQTFKSVRAFNRENRIRASVFNKCKDYAQSRLIRSTFYEWQIIGQINSKTRALVRTVKLNRQIHFIRRLRSVSVVHQQQKKTFCLVANQLESAFQRHLMSHQLRCWLIAAKIQAVFTLRKVNSLRMFNSVSRKLRAQKVKSVISLIHLIESIVQKAALFKILGFCKHKKSLHHYDVRLKSKYFTMLKVYARTQASYRQIENSNEIILKHYLIDKYRKGSRHCLNLESKYFQKWLYALRQTQQLRNAINFQIKESVERTSNSVLQNSFLKIQQFSSEIKARNHHETVLKFKAISSLSKELIHSSLQLQKLYRFVEQRSVRKYFDRIKRFNHEQSKRVNSLILKKAWTLFCISIGTWYYQNQQKADQYRQTLLKFKVFLELKENMVVNKKMAFCAFWLNVQRPIERWAHRFRVRKFCELKQGWVIKRVFWEWRLQAVRKQLNYRLEEADRSPIQEIDQQRQTEQVDSQGQTSVRETSFFQKLNLDSQKTFEEVSESPKRNRSADIRSIQQPGEKLAKGMEEGEMDSRIDLILARINRKKQSKRGSSRPREEPSAVDSPDASIERLRLPTWSSNNSGVGRSSPAKFIGEVSVFEEEEG